MYTEIKSVESVIKRSIIPARVLLCPHSASDTDFLLPESRQGRETLLSSGHLLPVRWQMTWIQGSPFLYPMPGASHRPVVCSLLVLRDHPSLSLAQPQSDFMKRAKDLKYGGPMNKWAPVDKKQQDFSHESHKRGNTNHILLKRCS